jgi:hypothetical protein
MERNDPTTLQALGYMGLTTAISLPVMILVYRWFTG